MKQNRRDRTEAPDMLPPHDEQAEFMLLACAVHKPDTLVSLTEELFYDRRAKSVFAAMQQLRADNRQVTERAETFEHELMLRLDRQNFEPINAALNDLPSTANYPYWLDKVQDCANAPMWWVSTPYTGPRAAGINIATSLPLPVNPPAGSLITVSLQLVPTNNVLAYAVEDHPPTGWADVQNISHGGSYDALNRAVKWGPFYDNGTRELTYEIVRPPGAAGTNTFAGLASFDGFNAVISGGRTIFLPATNGTPATWVSLQRDNNGASFTFSLRGVPASRYAIEFTTNLITWSILQTNLTDTGGNYLLRVTNSPPAAYQFYRARFVN